MLRVLSRLPEGHADRRAASGRLVLAHDQRRLRRKLLALEDGTEAFCDFPEPVSLADGDHLVLEDGRQVAIAAAEEALYAVFGRDAAHLTRLAWHIGNRHTPAQLESGRILIARDHVLKAMLEGLGARIGPVTEPFAPEHGAYHAHAHADPGHALVYRK